MPEGLIIKGVGGFYYVEAADVVYECKARGIFRKRKITPLAGDRVEFSVNEQGENTIDEILPRKNELARPPLANLDRLFVIASVADPPINTVTLDRVIAVAEHRGIEPIVVITKSDLTGEYIKYRNIYSKAGFKVIVCNNKTGEGSGEVKELLGSGISAFAGNTGVGKSSLLNNIAPRLALAVGETSKKLGRGRHTTRHCELYRIGGGYVADTPGFSSIDIEAGDVIFKEDLSLCFREFEPYLGKCRFSNNCSHTEDKGCAVLKAADDGLISQSRLDSYKIMYNEVKDIKKWQSK